MHALSGPALLRIARAAADRASQYSSDAPVAVAFALFAVECFVNELLFHVRTSEQDALVGGLALLKRLISTADLEERQTPLRRRIDVISTSLTGGAADFGRRPFQDLVQLQRMRDALVHARPEFLKTEPAVSSEGIPTQRQTEVHELGRFLIERGVLPPHSPEAVTALLSILCQPAVARWAHDCAVDAVTAILNWLPSDGWRVKAGFAYELSLVPSSAP